MSLRFRARARPSRLPVQRQRGRAAARALRAAGRPRLSLALLGFRVRHRLELLRRSLRCPQRPVEGLRQGRDPPSGRQREDGHDQEGEIVISRLGLCAAHGPGVDGGEGDGAKSLGHRAHHGAPAVGRAAVLGRHGVVHEDEHGGEPGGAHACLGHREGHQRGPERAGAVLELRGGRDGHADGRGAQGRGEHHALAAQAPRDRWEAAHLEGHKGQPRGGGHAANLLGGPVQTAQ
mmetsp:Transcript_2431/g.8057  ORF Transcript_2431/g.8057 Transcript_2431/m.8057 type:complete len:234 (-) Transcript_2431:376-1077(-)